ncbi:isochorismatase family protein [Saccharopolyspora sp. MS10]|uniref:isochorismatase family protein n=1 Tax=Saccharopolyspora sp. MS10 TaxID=3385973 RepID=UPI00399EF4AB
MDVQIEYMATAAGGTGTVRTLTALRDRALASGVPVVQIQHREPGFGPERAGWALAIPPTGSERVLVKEAPDSFLGTGLAELLRAEGVRTLVIGGFSTEYCVDSTVRSALSEPFDVLVPDDGHTTATTGGVLPPEDIIAHHNHVFAGLSARARCRVVPAARISFGTGSAARAGQHR